MNVALAQLACLFRHRRVLSGGYASARFKRDLSQATRHLGALFHACDWLDSVVEPYPSFFEQPLLGTCLTELTSAFGAPASETNPEPQEEPRLRSPAMRQNPVKPNPFERTAASSSRASPVAESPGTIPIDTKTSREFHFAADRPRQADRALLERLAGGSLKIRRVEAKASKQISAPPPAGSESLSAKAAASASVHPWQRVVAARAANAWLQSQRSLSPLTAPDSLATSTKNQTPATPSGAVSIERDVATAPPAAGTDAGAMFQQQWTTRVDGVQAAPGILVNLIKGSSQAPPSVSGRAPSDVANPASSPFPSAKTAPPVPSSRENSRRSFDVSATSADAQRRSLESVSEVQRNSDVQTQIVPNAALDNSQQFTAPVLTPSLPPLLPTVSPGTTARPIAVDTARQISWRDEAYAQDDDLSVLASQIKRILDEEARRHGIDI